VERARTFLFFYSPDFGDSVGFKLALPEIFGVVEKTHSMTAPQYHAVIWITTEVASSISTTTYRSETEIG